jgi:hypothetical protein
MPSRSWLATETVEAQRAGADADCSTSAPIDLLLVVERQPTNPARHSVEYTRLRYRADLYRYQAQLYRRGSLPFHHRQTSLRLSITLDRFLELISFEVDAVTASAESDRPWKRELAVNVHVHLHRTQIGQEV